VVALELHLVVLERENRVRAPLVVVGLPAARRAAAAPFVREQDLVAVVAERGRVPEREIRVGDRRKPARMGGVADVEQQAVAAARAAGQSDRGIDGDVMALLRTRARAFRTLPLPVRIR